jgi:hypothetical protein
MVFIKQLQLHHLLSQRSSNDRYNNINNNNNIIDRGAAVVVGTIIHLSLVMVGNVPRSSSSSSNPLSCGGKGCGYSHHHHPVRLY